MIAAAVIICVLILILLLRFGAEAEYGDDGIKAYAQIGSLYIQLYPQKQGKVKKEKKRTKKKRRAKEKHEKPQKPGKLIGLSDVIPVVKKALSRLRRRLLIKKLTIHYTAGSENAFKTALSYGTSNAVFGSVTALLENSFRIKERDFRAGADFTAKEPYIYVNAAFTLAVWEAIYIAISALPLIFNKNQRGKKNGKTSDR